MGFDLANHYKFKVENRFHSSKKKIRTEELSLPDLFFFSLAALCTLRLNQNRLLPQKSNLHSPVRQTLAGSWSWRRRFQQSGEMDLDLWIVKVKEGQHLAEHELQSLCEYVRPPSPRGSPPHFLPPRLIGLGVGVPSDERLLIVQ